MRPLLVLIIGILFVVSAYYDLKSGTIPRSPALEQSVIEESSDQEIGEQEENRETVPTPGEISFPYQEVIVESGYTVYGIVKALHGETGFTIPANTVVEDFEALNPHVEAHQILIGETYRFPLYSFD